MAAKAPITKRTPLIKNIAPKRILSPTNIIIFGFMAIIGIGAILLCMPVSSASGEFTSPITALFVATSATCVTGLTTVDTGIYWSGFGQGVILAMIQVGGLGFMSLAMIFSVLLKRHVSPKERVIFIKSMNLSTADGLIPFSKKVVTFAFSAEAIGAAMLAVRFVPLFGWAKGIKYSVFHAVSAFCNAGFDLLGSEHGAFAGFAPYADDVYLNVVLCLLIISGGLGFIVWNNVFSCLKEKSRISFYSKLAIFTTLGLIVFGTAAFALLEWNNPNTVGGADSAVGKLIRSLFQSVTLRTAGFSTIPQGELSGGSKLISMLLMFIGGSSGSTAGGIKTVTAALVVIATVNIIKGNRDVNFRRHQFDKDAVSRAFALVSTGLAAAVGGGMLIRVTDGSGAISLTSALYEAFSAFGTTGVTIGITTGLSVFGQLVVIGLMFFGRIGITTIMYAILIGSSGQQKLFSYPHAQVPIG